MAGENWTFWLMMTNYALAMITVLALSVVFVAVCWDLIVLKVRKARTMDHIDSELRAMLHAGSRSLSVPELGRTMADGASEWSLPNPNPQTRNPRGELWRARFLKKVEHDIATLHRCGS